MHMVNCDTCQTVMRLQRSIKQKDAYISNILMELNQYKRMARQKKSDLSDVQMQSSDIIRKLQYENNDLKDMLRQYKSKLNNKLDAKRKPMGTPKLSNWDISTLRQDDLF